MPNQKHEKSCGVYFNMRDKEQEEVYKYAKNMFNFSGHIKYLLKLEMNGLLFNSQSNSYIDTNENELYNNLSFKSDTDSLL
jgi:hypothetical protein